MYKLLTSGGNMSPIQLTPAALIKLMEGSRSMQYSDMIRLMDAIRIYRGVLTPETLTNFIQEVNKESAEIFSDMSDNIKLQIKQILINFLNANDVNITDAQVTKLLGDMKARTSPKGPVNATDLTQFLADQLSNSDTTLDEFNMSELDQMLGESEIDEHGSQVLLQREEDLPLASTQVSDPAKRV
jgi:hypothetical protein